MKCPEFANRDIKDISRKSVEEKVIGSGSACRHSNFLRRKNG
jgi:hypothetical protein